MRSWSSQGRQHMIGYLGLRKRSYSCAQLPSTSMIRQNYSLFYSLRGFAPDSFQIYQYSPSSSVLLSCFHSKNLMPIFLFRARVLAFWSKKHVVCCLPNFFMPRPLVIYTINAFGRWYYSEETNSSVRYKNFVRLTGTLFIMRKFAQKITFIDTNKTMARNANSVVKTIQL